MKTKAIILTAAVMLSAAPTFSQVSINDILKTMPQAMAPYLTTDQLTELSHDAELQLQDEKDGKAEGDTVLNIKNRFGGTTRIDSIGTNYVNLSISEASNLQLRLLACNDTTEIICAVRTFNKPLKESTVEFYDSDWKPLTRDFGLLKMNVSEDSLMKQFVVKPDTMTQSTFDELCKYLDPVIISADISKDGYISYKLSLPFIPRDKKDEIKAITKQKSLKWNGNTFKEC